MKITDYYPIFYTENFETEIKKFTDNLGFTVIHQPQIEFLDYAVLENENKRRVDIVRSHFPGDSFKEGYLGMRVNLDNFEEGVSFFEGQGYTIFGDVHETDASVVALLTKGDDTYLVLFQHK